MLRDLVNVSAEIYYEVTDSEMYGGEGTTGYMSIQFGQIGCIENMTEEVIDATRVDVAKTLKVPVEKVRIISKEEYDFNVEEFEED